MPEATTTPKPATGSLADEILSSIHKKRDVILAEIVRQGAKLAASKPAQALKAAEAELAEIDALLGRLETSSGPEIIPHAPPVDDSAAGAAAETAPAIGPINTAEQQHLNTYGRTMDALPIPKKPAHVAADDAGPIPAGPMVRS